jgi:hypothetical protein
MKQYGYPKQPKHKTLFEEWGATLGAVAWIALSIYVAYTQSITAVWVFIALTVLLTIVGIVAAVLDPTPIRRHKTKTNK